MSGRVPSAEKRLLGSLVGYRVCLMAGVAALLTAVSVAEVPVSEVVYRVEEDWTLVLNEPDGNVNAPQFHTVMSPYGHFDEYFAQVTWNYRELPDFEAGGFEIQGWQSDEVQHLKDVGEYPLSTSAETITWTQTLATNGNELAFAILNGQSTSWGAFGGSGTAVGGSVGVANLNEYSTDTTAENSCVTYGENRVKLLMISEVRYYGANGLLYTDTTPRVLVTTQVEED